MESYPIMFNAENQPASVIGGGRVAYRKVKRLIESGAAVTVISPDLCPELEELASASMFTWKKKTFDREDIRDAFIVIAATDDKAVNRTVANAVFPRQLVNIVDDPELGNFHVPASLHQGKLTISVATGGASPFLAKRIRNDLKLHFDSSYQDYMTFLEEVRRLLHRLDCLETDRKHQLLRDIAEDAYRKSAERRQALLDYLHKMKETGKMEEF